MTADGDGFLIIREKPHQRRAKEEHQHRSHRHDDRSEANTEAIGFAHAVELLCAVILADDRERGDRKPDRGEESDLLDPGGNAIGGDGGLSEGADEISDNENPEADGRQVQAGRQGLRDNLAHGRPFRDHVREGFPRDEPGPGGAIVDVDTADKFDRNGRERDAGQTQRWNSQAAIEEPGIEQAVEHETEDQEIPVRRRVAGGLQDGVDDADHHEEDRAAEDHIHE